MGHAQTPDTYPEVVRSQPQSASMSTSSQYYRSANPHSHYQNYQSNPHDQAYPNYTGAWQDSNQASYTGPSSVSLLQYPQTGLSSDFPRPHQPPPPETWEVGYAQPGGQPWSATVNAPANEQSFEARLSGSYNTVEGGTSVQRRAPNLARQYTHPHQQQVSTAEHEQPLASPDVSHRNAERFSTLRITSVSANTMYSMLSFN